MVIQLRNFGCARIIELGGVNLSDNPLQAKYLPLRRVH